MSIPLLTLIALLAAVLSWSYSTVVLLRQPERIRRIVKRLNKRHRKSGVFMLQFVGIVVSALAVTMILANFMTYAKFGYLKSWTYQETLSIGFRTGFEPFDNLWDFSINDRHVLLGVSLMMVVFIVSVTITLRSFRLVTISKRVNQRIEHLL